MCLVHIVVGLIVVHQISVQILETLKGIYRVNCNFLEVFISMLYIAFLEGMNE